MGEHPKYFLVDSQILPEVYLKDRRDILPESLLRTAA